jgi:alkylhydroperoxidase family enzyme
MAHIPLPWRSAATTDGDVRRVLGKLEASGKDIPIVRLVANWEQGFRPFVLMADALLSRGRLTPATREVAVLRIAATLDLPYEWNEHVPMSERAGVTDDQRAALARKLPPSEELFDEEQRLALEVVDAVLEEGPPPAALWAEACERLGEQAALELVFGVAWWGGFVPVVTRSLMPLAEGAVEAD